MPPISFSSMKTSLGLTPPIRMSAIHTASGGTAGAPIKSSVLSPQVVTYTTGGTGTWYPQSALSGNPVTMTIKSIAYTFASTNMFGDVKGGYIYAFDGATTTMTQDNYNASTGICNTTTTLNGYRGFYQGIISTTAFICVGYKGWMGSSSGGPKRMLVFGTNDGVTFTTLDDWTITTTSTYVNGYDNVSPGVTRTFTNTTPYKRYYVVMNTTLNTSGVTWLEWRWKLSV